MSYVLWGRVHGNAVRVERMGHLCPIYEIKENTEDVIF